MEIFLTKVGGGLVPATDEDREKFNKLRRDVTLRANVTHVRNYKFLKKFMALISVGFDAWEPKVDEYKGHVVQKNRERFREDVTIAAGFYDVVADLRGNVHARAKSISFANMSEDEFENVYSKVVDVLLQDVLAKYTREDLDNVVNQILSFT